MKIANNVPIQIAAKAMGKSPQFVRIGLQRGILPIGAAFKTDEKNKTSCCYKFLK